GSLTVIGRRDAVIITGGKKVQPERVEAVLKAALAGAEVAVVGVPDAEWGEKVACCLSQSLSAPPDAAALAQLAPHERPKLWLTVDPWPVNAQGKLNRAALREAASRLISGRG
ncbi:MAG: o-succinylbenzoate--CoA ligase, partial [Opitutaceae bacterium]